MGIPGVVGIEAHLVGLVLRQINRCSDLRTDGPEAGGKIVLGTGLIAACSRVNAQPGLQVQARETPSQVERHKIGIADADSADFNGSFHQWRRRGVIRLFLGHGRIYGYEATGGNRQVNHEFELGAPELRLGNKGERIVVGEGEEIVVVVLELAFGKEGKWAVLAGPAGYGQWQTTANQRPDSLGNRYTIDGVGFTTNLTTPYKGIYIGTSQLWEYDAKATYEGRTSVITGGVNF